MKLFTFLLAVMVLALSCVPCMDDSFAANDGKAKAEISKSGQQKEHSNTDACSPFCTCNCCTGFTFVFTHWQVTHPVLQAPEKITPHLPAEISNIALPVWQPPPVRLILF